MNRTELLDHLETLGIALLCLNFIMVFIIPGAICRLVQDRKVQEILNRNKEIVQDT